jgi:hypothetical protein
MSLKRIVGALVTGSGVLILIGQAMAQLRC